MTAKKALVTRITGQDGSYLAELLLEKGYEVHGLIRRSGSFSTGRIDHLYRDPHEPDVRLFLHYSDLTDSSSLVTWLNRIKPDDVYNLGAQSHVGVSFELPEFTADTAGMGTLRLLEAIRHDAAEGIVLAAECYDAAEPVNLGVGREITIRDLVALIVQLTGFEGDVRWDSSKPDGQPRRALDTSRARERFGFVARTAFNDGLRESVAWYAAGRDPVR